MPTGDTETIISCKSKGLLDESIKPPTKPGNSLLKTEWQWCCSGVFIVNLKHISHLVLMFLLLALSR